MRTQFLKFIAITMVAFTSCSTDDDSDKGLGPEPNLSLTFNMETAQDQMGDFADNAMAIFDSKVWSFGGINDYAPFEEYTDAAWYSNNGANWVSNADDLTAEGRHAHTLTFFNDKLYLIGGEDYEGNWFGDLHYTSNGTNWTQRFEPLPFGDITAHQTIVYDDKLFVIAGDITTGFTKVWSTPDGDTWSEETSNAFSGRGGHQAVVLNDAMYVIGGEDIAGNKLNEIWRSTNGSTWTQVSISGSMFSPRNAHSATVYNNKVWVIGGRDASSDFKNDIWYSSNMTEWTQYDGLVPFYAVASHAVLNYNDALWLFGGYKSGGISGAIWRITED